MPSNKPRVTSYLDETENKLFQELKEKFGYSDSQAVQHLINQGLTPSQEPVENDEYDSKWEERVSLLETGTKVACDLARQTAKRNECLTERLAHVQQELDNLNKAYADLTSEPITDDVIAAVTGQREETVREWRHGLRKPRGERILRKLAPYEIQEGRWVRVQS